MQKKSSGLKLAAAAAVVLSLVAAAPAPQNAGSAAHGLDLGGMDRDAKAGDDFYQLANGSWMKNTEIPADRSRLGSFNIVADLADKRTAEIIREASKSSSADAKKIADFYAAFMDETSINEKGLLPLQAELTSINAISDPTALARYIGSHTRADVDPMNNAVFHTSRLFGIWVSPDMTDPSHNIAYLLQGGLGMPDRDNYKADDEKGRELQAKYLEHITNILTLAGAPDAAARAARIYALEDKLAAAHETRTDSSEVQRAKRWKLSEFRENAPGFDWNAYFAAAGLSQQQYVYVWQPPAIRGIAAVAAWEPLATWKDYLAYQAIDRASEVLAKPYADERFRFYGTVMNGTTAQRERWQRAVVATNDALGMAVGRLYADRYFPPASKLAAEKMVKQIKAAFGERIDRLEWMSASTKKKAKAKLSALYVGVGYPEKWTDYSGLVVSRDDAYGNRDRAEVFAYQRAIAKLGKPVDRTEWSMTPQTVNAVNLPIQNALNFPAAILNPPFFDAATDPAQNFGAIGTVIGHEISHAFDDQGALFDADGRLANWWTNADFEHFTKAGDRLAQQYDTYEPLPGSHIDGKLTLGENIADVAGISAAYDGYRKVYGGKEGPTVQGLTGDQRFFLSFAQVWRTKQRPESLRNSLVTNGHAPGPFRALTVRNIDAWYKAFGVKAGDKLYLDPKARVRIW